MNKEYDTTHKEINELIEIITSLIYFKIYSFLGATKKTSVHFDVINIQI